MSEEIKKRIQVAYIGEGEIKREVVDDPLKQAAIVRATLKKDGIKQENKEAKEHLVASEAIEGSAMKKELLRKLQLQREKIHEEQERCLKAKEAFEKQLEERKANRQETLYKER